MQPDQTGKGKPDPKPDSSMERDREDIERDEHYQPEHEPASAIQTPDKREQSRRDLRRHQFMISGIERPPTPPEPSPIKSAKQQMLDMGYPEHLIQVTKDGKAFFDAGAAEDEALFNAFSSDAEPDEEA